VVLVRGLLPSHAMDDLQFVLHRLQQGMLAELFARLVVLVVNSASQASAKAAAAVGGAQAGLQAVSGRGAPCTLPRPASPAAKVPSWVASGSRRINAAGSSRPAQAGHCAAAGGTASGTWPAASARASSGPRSQAAVSQSASRLRRCRRTSIR
jgi:hypothetical protein